MVVCGNPSGWTYKSDRWAFCSWCWVSAVSPGGPVWADNSQMYYCTRCWNHYNLKYHQATYTLYLAFSAADARIAQNMGEIAATTFWPVSYIPLRDTAEFAIESAMRGATKQAAQTANNTTVWWVAEVSLKFADMAGNIQRAHDHKGWRRFESLSLRDEHTKWMQHRMDPVGLSAWAEWFLRHRPLVQEHHAVCSSGQLCVPACNGQLWAVSTAAFHERYCAACWNRHFQDISHESVFKQSPNIVEEFECGFCLVERVIA